MIALIRVSAKRLDVTHTTRRLGSKREEVNLAVFVHAAPLSGDSAVRDNDQEE
jgi:hypothetical protein